MNVLQVVILCAYRTHYDYFVNYHAEYKNELEKHVFHVLTILFDL